MGEKTVAAVTGGVVLTGGVLVAGYGAAKVLKKMKENVSDIGKVSETPATLAVYAESSQGLSTSKSVPPQPQRSFGLGTSSPQIRRSHPEELPQASTFRATLASRVDFSNPYSADTLFMYDNPNY